MQAQGSSLPLAFNSQGPAWRQSHSSLSHWLVWNQRGLAFLPSSALIIRVTLLPEALQIEIMLHFVRLGPSIQNIKLFKYFKKIIDYFKNYINIVLGLKYCKIKWNENSKQDGEEINGSILF